MTQILTTDLGILERKLRPVQDSVAVNIPERHNDWSANK